MKIPTEPDFLQLRRMLIDQEISGKIALVIFKEMLASGKGPRQVVYDLGLSTLEDRRCTEEEIHDLLNQYTGPNDVDEKIRYVIKRTNHRANPADIYRVLYFRGETTR